MTAFLTGLSARLLSPTTRRGLTTGIGLFLAIKLIAVSFGILSMQGPRIGDDSYVYLWFARASPWSDLGDSVAVSSIRKFESRIDANNLSPELKFERDRVMLRVPAQADMLLQGLLEPVATAPLSFYTMFWVQEVLIALAMALGLWLLLLPTPRPPGLLFLLPLLALAFFPLQGLHFLIPSTLALSFGMMVWGLVLADRARPVSVFVAGALAMLAHPIGIAHAGAGGVLALIRFAQRRASWRLTFAHALALLAVLGCFLTLEALGVKGTEKIAGATRLAIADIPYNLAGLASALLDFLRDDVFAALTCIFGAVSVLRSSGDNRRTLVAIVIAFSLMASVYTLDAYPGEASTRFAVPVLAICFLYAYAAAPDDAAGKPWVGLSWTVFAVAMSLSAVGYALGNRDGRIPDISRAELQEALLHAGKDAHLLYVDGDMAMQASLVAGAENNFTSALGLLKADPQAAQAWLTEHPADYLVTVLPNELMLLRGIQRPLWRTAPYGFPLSQGRLTLELVAGTTQIWIRAASTQDLRASGPAGVCTQESVGNRWIRIQLEGCMHSDVWVLNVDGSDFISGLSTGEPTQNVSWPWNQEVKWAFTTWTPLGGEKVVKGDFSYRFLDHRLDSATLETYRGRLTPFDDQSGVVFLKVR